jgi:serine/threonine-protein kinase
VIAQAPTADSQVPKHSVVTITVSKGPEQVTVPDVVGSTEVDARDALRGAGLLAGVFRVTSDRPVGTVVAQDPKGGERVAKESTVRLNVSKAPPVAKTSTAATTTTSATVTATTTVTSTTSARTTTAPATATVPDVVGQSQNQARHTLKDAGLRAAVAYVHASLPFDQVVAQFPRPGTTAKSGDKVRINVSLGPNPKPQVAVPDVTSDDETTAASSLRAAGFRIETVDQATGDPSADGVVLGQDPAGGSRAPSGSTITIYVGRYGG